MGGRPLVLIIDIDNDINSVVGSSVVRGEEGVLEAALTYAMDRPEDADLNAIFSGLSIYRRLKSQGREPEIAIVGGEERDIVGAQTKVRERVRELLEEIGDKRELYIVGDGLDEIMVAEVLGDLAPVAAVKRVVVEQQESIETSYALLLRYAKKALGDPRFSRYTLGIPGLIISVMAILSLFGLLYEALKIAALLFGAAMFIKGFGLEGLAYGALIGALESFREAPLIKLIGLILGATLVLGGIAITYGSYVSGGAEGALVRALTSGIPVSLIGIIMYVFVAKVFSSIINRDVKLLSHISIISAIFFLALASHSLGTQLATKLQAEEMGLGEALYGAIVGSNFIPLIMSGAAIAAMLEIIERAIVATRRSSSSAD